MREAIEAVIEDATDHICANVIGSRSEKSAHVRRRSSQRLRKNYNLRRSQRNSYRQSPQSRIRTKIMDVRMIAHDMRTPLSALSLCLTAVKTQAGNPIAQAELFEMMEKNIKAVTIMVQSLLATSEHGPWTKGTLTFRECLPLELVASAIDQIAPLAAAKHQNLESGEMVALPALVADGERIIRVLVNLLSNAVKFTPAHGTIKVDAKARANDGHPAIVFTVADTGCGVPAAEIDRIFDEGVSIAPPGTYSSGLGLAVCKELVESHGGKIWVEPNHSSGAVFSFALPSDRKSTSA